MGSGVVGGFRILCEGDDIIGALNDVFDHKPGEDPRYDFARLTKEFFNLAAQSGDWQLLLAAYRAAGVQVTSWDHWGDYLRDLSTKDPNNIKTIAQARYDGLSAGKKMKTKKHPAKGSDHKVHRKDNGSIEIDSPFDPNTLCT